MDRLVGILKGGQIPSCDDTGLYNHLQCDTEAVCWCVNQTSGEEIGNLRSPSTTLSHCK